jgi:hypothetical protein
MEFPTFIKNPESKKEKPDFFNKPIDQQKILDSAKEIRYGFKTLIGFYYSEKIREGLNFFLDSDGRTVSFSIKNDLLERVADLQFDKIDDSFVLTHRYIKKMLASFGIGSSEFLSKAEEILKFLLLAENNTEIKHFKINAAQVNVIKWALKNFYEFQNEEEEKLFNSIIENNDEQYVITDEFSYRGRYGTYIFKKENIPEARKLFEQQKESLENDGELDIRKLSVRFTLAKEI